MDQDLLLMRKAIAWLCEQDSFKMLIDEHLATQDPHGWTSYFSKEVVGSRFMCSIWSADLPDRPDPELMNKIMDLMKQDSFLAWCLQQVPLEDETEAFFEDSKVLQKIGAAVLKSAWWKKNSKEIRRSAEALAAVEDVQDR
jgi:hypothetical protein